MVASIVNKSTSWIRLKAAGWKPEVKVIAEPWENRGQGYTCLESNSSTFSVITFTMTIQLCQQ
jgi:hypothetical protein